MKYHNWNKNGFLINTYEAKKGAEYTRAYVTYRIFVKGVNLVKVTVKAAYPS
jgi:DNA-directed RNA polymerase subunit RPC12/RpoP